jgi:hypothetical protein
MSEREVRVRECSTWSTERDSSSSKIAGFTATDLGGGRRLSGLAAREVAYEEIGTGRDVFERIERADVDATDSVRLRLGSWEVTAGTASEDGPLLALAMLAIEPLQEDALEDVERREVRRERAAAVMWKRSFSERGDGPGMGGRGREGGREGGGFDAWETFWGIKVGGTGNSLRRTGTGVLRLCLRDMVEEEEGVCAFAHEEYYLKVTEREQKRRHRRSVGRKTRNGP